MKFIFNKYIGVLTGIVAIIVLTFIIAGRSDETISYYEVQRGDIEVVVTVTGELESENSVNIEGPQELNSRNIRISRVPILDMVPEGTVVERGDWIATLDRTEAISMLVDLEDLLTREEAQYSSTILDSSMRLSGLRNDIVNLENGVEERRIILGQSIYEPPATIRQAEINLERAIIDLHQARDQYVLVSLQQEENVRDASIVLERRRTRVEELRSLIEKFDITAPQAGMVIYRREWNGTKRRIGSNITPRDRVVATLPDLSSLVSRTYVNEMDIDNVRVGQEVRIGLDAFPDNQYTGLVTEISNVGQTLPSIETKVFEVMILLNDIDRDARPAMTTINYIITEQVKDVNYLPLSAIHYSNGIPYVYTSNGTRQVVIVGSTNGYNIVVEKGLETGELVHATRPENGIYFEFVGGELIAEQD